MIFFSSASVLGVTSMYSFVCPSILHGLYTYTEAEDFFKKKYFCCVVSSAVPHPLKWQTPLIS